jgi:hypothetical protein
MARKIEMQQYESTVTGATDDAMSTLEDLASEVRGVYDNMPESLQSGNRGDMLNAAADELEYLSAPDVPDCIAEVTVSFSYKPDRRPSRSDRRYEAVRMLEEARDAAQGWYDDDANAEHEERDEVESFIGELEEIISTAKNVEFPGMYS